MNERGTVVTAMIALMVIGIIGLLLVVPFIRNGYNRHQQVLHIDKTERVQSQSGSTAKYLVFAQEGTYENTDSLLNGKWNSSDLYGQLKGGKTYNCLVYGWRNGFFSTYPNILNCTEING